MSKFDAIVFGPGISQIYQPYQEMIDKFADKKKMLIDAGGLKYLSKDKKYENVIITPHIGELSAFTKMSKEEISQNPISCLRKLAKNGLTLVLKGPTTIVQGQRYTYLLQAKNTGLATAGTGDVLAGIISSYMVDDSLVNACVRGVAVHSIAAEYAKQKFGEVSMTASDLIDNLYKVWVRKR
jgi:NAD(P)H-hydrate epimerase